MCVNTLSTLSTLTEQHGKTMKFLHIQSSLAGRFPTQTLTASHEGGELTPGERQPGSAALDPFLYQDRWWCSNCGGERMFQPVDRFPHGWRGYCMGCEDVVYVVDERTNAEAC